MSKYALYAFQCPDCGSTRIGVEATALLVIVQTPDGEWETEPPDGYEYDDYSPGICLDCDRLGRLRSFHTQE